MNKSVYKNIYGKRSQKNYTQEYMAAQLSMTQTHYSKIERSVIDISVYKLIEIGKILNIDPTDFFLTQKTSF
ncbi:helix-turn-helix domain-containing protein [Flavobacterium qiangtangense]|uniref:Helix-turn-helix domain-containing protein n=1 Tax=Flavobacterium qiangtangense TaxID=1442595 RepID=A0ABW1PM54_9FLAO